MVEQEHTKSSTVFSESLISNNTSQNYAPNEWFSNDAKPMLIKSDELCDSDLLNVELLYASVMPTDAILPPTRCVAEKDNILLEEPLPNDMFSTNDILPCDLYYNDQNMSNTKDYWIPLSENIPSASNIFSDDISPLSFWGSCPFDLETLKMDDVFQVDKDDLVSSPTLAALNANDESIELYDSFDNYGITLPSEQKFTKSSLLPTVLNPVSAYKLPSLNEAPQLKTTSETSSDRTNSALLPMDSVKKINAIAENEMRSDFSPKDSQVDSLSSDTLAKNSDSNNACSQLITKVVKKNHPLIESSIKTYDAKRIEDCSPLTLPSNIETLDSEDDDSEMDFDYSTDVDEESDEESKAHRQRHVTTNHLLLQKKKSRYFWQYNIQSKGPKAPKVKIGGKSVATDNFSGVSDPVFSSINLIKGIKHAGKARRGDGNDLTPNPQKLYNIGIELEKLTSVIEGLVPANELPLNARSKSRKEKNKLASRACRLKKKAQHEANKLKLFGLQKEQKHLVGIVTDVKKIIKKSVDNAKHGKVQSSVHAKIEALTSKKCYTEVAGCSSEFVNNVLKKVDLGDKTGGLNILALEGNDE